MEPETGPAPEDLDRLANRETGLLDDLLASPALAEMATAGPTQAEVVVVSAALSLFGLLFPFAVLAFAAINLRRGTSARVLFVSALVSSGLALAAGLAVWLVPAARPDRAIAQDWRGFVLVFLYAWVLLDFGRGARLTRLRPRLPAIVAVLCLGLLGAAFVLVAT
jgi:hypothetical protein